MTTNSKPQFVFRIHTGAVQQRLNIPGQAWRYAAPIAADAYLSGFHAGAFHAGNEITRAVYSRVSDLTTNAIVQLLSGPLALVEPLQARRADTDSGTRGKRDAEHHNPL